LPLSCRVNPVMFYAGFSRFVFRDNINLDKMPSQDPPNILG